jgi:hypothetical protein
VVVSDASEDLSVDRGLDVAVDSFRLDTGIPNVLDAGGAYEGGVPCVVGGLLETEPANDTPEGADTLNAQYPTRCGATVRVAAADADAGDAEPGDAGAGDGGAIADVDYLKFQLEDASTSFFLYFEGSVKLTVTVEVDGGTQTVVMTPTSSPPVPFVKDKTYVVKVESLDGSAQDWRVTLFQS